MAAGWRRRGRAEAAERRELAAHEFGLLVAGVVAGRGSVVTGHGRIEVISSATFPPDGGGEPQPLLLIVATRSGTRPRRVWQVRLTNRQEEAWGPTFEFPADYVVGSCGTQA